MKKAARIVSIAFISILFAGMCLFPIYIVFKISLSAPRDIFAQNPPYLIENFTLSHFREVLSSGDAFFGPLAKSMMTAALAGVLGVLVSIPAAYAISKFDFRLRYALILVIFVTRMVPEVSIALPISISFMKMGLFDTIPGLVMAHLVRILPVSCFMMVGVFSGMPKDIEGQAYVDGATRMAALTKVVLPVSLSGISVAGMFSFLLSWDEFIYASYLTLANPTMPLKMYYYISRGDLFYSATYAVIITAPVIILTAVLQRYIRPGYLSGAIRA